MQFSELSAPNKLKHDLNSIYFSHELSSVVQIQYQLTSLFFCCHINVTETYKVLKNEGSVSN